MKTSDSWIDKNLAISELKSMKNAGLFHTGHGVSIKDFCEKHGLTPSECLEKEMAALKELESRKRSGRFRTNKRTDESVSVQEFLRKWRIPPSKCLEMLINGDFYNNETATYSSGYRRHFG